MTRNRSGLLGPGAIGVTWDERQARGGLSANRTIRAVCSGCNSGWMSDLETDVQDLLFRQATEQRDVLTEPEAVLLTRWLAKTTAIFEWDDPESALLPQRALDAIASGDEGELRAHWKVHAAWVLGPQFLMTRGTLHAVPNRSLGHPGAEQLHSILQTITVNHAGYLIEFETHSGVFPNRFSGPPYTRQVWPDLDGRRRPNMNRAEWRYATDLGHLRNVVGEGDVVLG